jgi:hypothetical protein
MVGLTRSAPWRALRLRLHWSRVMREDMFKVIVERPRLGGGNRRKGRSRPFEDLPSKIGMRRFHEERSEHKWLNENLAPLRRYLEQQVGRPWNQVYSEICARLSVRHVVQQHVREHLTDFVEVVPAVIQTRWRPVLYVDPKDGLLKRTDRTPEARARRRREAEAKRRKPEVTRVDLSADRALQRIDGTWYELTLARLPDPEFRPTREMRPHRWHPKKIEVTVRRLVSPPVLDAALGKAIPVGPSIDTTAAWRQYDCDHPGRRYARAKRQLSRTELRRHGLANLMQG